MKFERFSETPYTAIAAVTLGALVLTGCNASAESASTTESSPATIQHVVPRIVDDIDCTFIAVIDPEDNPKEAKQCADDQENAVIELVAFGSLTKDQAEEIALKGTSYISSATDEFVEPDYFVRTANFDEKQSAKKSTCTNETSPITWLSSSVRASDSDNWIVAASNRYSCSETSLGIASQNNGRRQIDILKADETTINNSAATYAHEVLHIFGNIGHSGQIQTDVGAELLSSAEVYDTDIDLEMLLKDANYFEYGTDDSEVMGKTIHLENETITLDPVLSTILKNPQHFASTGESLIKNIDASDGSSSISTQATENGEFFRVPLHKTIELKDTWVAQTGNGLSPSRFMNSLILMPRPDGIVQIGLLDDGNNYATLGEVSSTIQSSVDFTQGDQKITLSFDNPNAVICSVSK